jgi:hypothetical protein
MKKSPAIKRRWRVTLTWYQPMRATIKCWAYSESQAVAWAWICRDDHSYQLDPPNVAEDVQVSELADTGDQTDD